MICSVANLQPNYILKLMKNLSIRNQLSGTVQEIVRGPVVSEVIVKTAAGTLASVITTRSVRDLKLKKGDAVFVMVKATEASIQK
jgi:molybdopterin-binding protein